ncbi:MAG: hypothetical protein AMQ74_00543 [Candidatus Methanofastidiosum methylothiophilum]|uniref:Uncharacterized protein n=1 Tax=Candidatus Methanofastidiosum methylothiophilum TaxID=1705564 RepID=A0A150J704_9EURY|nr:MAG: hypothetical protein AMQ74_00543 [Candidatus Methanofastidiosum methylthiophilus]NMC76408.1 hypothetical protein [Candidatus Methanofastidiosa archaeon]
MSFEEEIIRNILVLATIPSILLIGILYGSRMAVHAPVMLALISAIGCFEIFKRIDRRAVGITLSVF